MAMLSLSEIYCDGSSDRLYLSINIIGRKENHLWQTLRPVLPDCAGSDCHLKASLAEEALKNASSGRCPPG